MNMHSRRSFISTYISPLLKEGRLQYTIKDQPTHPKQKYIATENSTSYFGNVNDSFGSVNGSVNLAKDRKRYKK